MAGTGSGSLAKAVLSGLIGGAAGLAAMDVVMKAAARALPDGTPRELEPGEDPSWSLVGVHHEPDESSTDALGRILYRRATGREPDARQKRRMSYAVHYSYGLAAAALYGAARARRAGRGDHDLLGGALFGVGLWLLGDELAVPLLGLADKPTRFRPSMHAQTLIGHIAYGVATAAAAQEARRRLV